MEPTPAHCTRVIWSGSTGRSMPSVMQRHGALAYVPCHSVEEISQITECPVTTVKARMHQASFKLRETTEVPGKAKCI